MTLTPIVEMHIEAETEDCVCPKLHRCGGIKTILGQCAEHGLGAGPRGKFHTHARQVDVITRGHWIR